MKIEHLGIENFRGVRGQFHLDLQPNLTIIYAPNGTGKTSLVDAVEWLFTGKLRRLTDLPEMDLRCRLAALDERSGVEANFIDLKGEPRRLSRTLEPSGQSLLASVRGGTTLTETQLLAWIAPSIRATSGNALSFARRAWLVGTRILDPETLRILLDDTDATSESRRNVFHDLLGVGELEKRRDALGKLRDPARRQSRDLKKRVDEADEAVKAAEGALRSEEARAVRGRATRIGADAALLQQIGVSTEVSSIEFQSSLRRLIEDTHALRIARETVSSGREALLHRRDRLQATRLHLEEARDWRRAFRTVHRGASDAEATASRALRRMQADFSERRAEYERISGLLVPDGPIPCDVGPIESWHARSVSAAKELQAAAEAARTAKASIEVRQRDLKDAIKLAERWRALSAEAGDHMSRLAILPDRAGLASRRAALSIERDAREAALGALESVLARLRAAEVEARALRPDSADCVVCGHVWESAVSLHRASDISAARLAGLYADDVAAVVRMDSERQSIDALVGEIDSVMAALKVVDEARRGIQADAEALAAGWPSDLPSMPTLEEAAAQPNCFEALVTTLMAAATAQTTAFILSSTRLEEAERERDRASRWQKYAEALKGISPDLATLGTSSPEQLVEAHQARCQVLAVMTAESESAIVREAEKAKGLVEDVVRLVPAMEEADRQVAALENNESTQVEVATLLESSWRLLADSETAPTAETVDSALEAAGRRVEASATLQRLADELTTLDNQSARQIGEAQGNLKACLEQRKAAALALNRVEEVVSKLEEAEACVSKVRDNVLNQTLGPLSDALTQIYGRLQANRFVQRITAYPTDRNFAVKTRPSVTDLALDPRELSQGQRLDLGLAIFLSRARAQGGTFFLDEPLVHLDELNRVALIDVFRAVLLERREDDPALSLVVTTANEQVADLFRDKLRFLGRHRFQLVRLRGNPHLGLSFTSS